jgi:hypothetical protein
LYNLSLVAPKAPREVLKSAFQQALKHAANPTEWIFENYGAGLKGYDNWIKDLESGKANRFGMGYNAAVWHECRTFAVQFLEEAVDRLDGQAGDLFQRAIQHYRMVADRLGALSVCYPWIPESGPQTIPIDNESQEAATWLEEARQAEENGLSVLKQIIAQLKIITIINFAAVLARRFRGALFSKTEHVECCGGMDKPPHKE